MAYIIGLLLGLSLIMAIGAQNLFVIKQGIKKEYSYYSAFICFLSDVLLISLSVTSINLLFKEYPFLNKCLLLFAIAFLIIYGLMSIRRGLKNKSSLLNGDPNIVTSRWKITMVALGFSLLNPHAILDTFVLIGGASKQYSHIYQYQFMLGAITASFIWFFGLTTIAIYLNKLLYYKRAWNILETLSGVLMLGIAVKVAGQV